MRQAPLYLIGCFALLASISASAEVKELSNTEMTEAYILDGSIIIKQKNAKTKPETTNKARIKLSAGKPAVTEADSVRELDQQATQQTIYDQSLMQRQAEQQLQQLEQANNNQLFVPSPLSPAAQAQQTYAQNLVRDGLGLPSGTQVTPELMGQYLSSFAGQTSGDPLRGQQTITNSGFQFIIPNLGGDIQSGIYSSGDGSINVESNNSQIIFNLLFPRNP
ncbi:hypothetical protein ACU6U9_15700 [Pseudomonas sp. HK3]|jgi:hypothetical protein